MRFVLTGLGATLAFRLKSARGWAIFLLPLLIFALSKAVPTTEVSAPVQVGVALPETGAEEFWELLNARGGAVVTFIASDAETIDYNVAACRWDCGLILDRNFSERLANLDLDQIIVLRIGPGSTVYPLVEETVSACMARLVSPRIAQQYLQDSGIGGADLPIVSERIDEDFAEMEHVSVVLSTVEGTVLKPLELADGGLHNILCWLVSVVLLVWLLLCAADMSRWLDRPAIRRLCPYQPQTQLMLTYIGADAVLALVTGSAAVLLLGRGLPGCLGVLSYVLLWTAVSMLLARSSEARAVLPVCVPFVTVLSLLLSSALVDFSLIMPALDAAARWSPAAVFLRICRGEISGAARLLGLSILCFSISFFVDLGQKQNN